MILIRVVRVRKYTNPNCKFEGKIIFVFDNVLFYDISSGNKLNVLKDEKIRLNFRNCFKGQAIYIPVMFGYEFNHSCRG